MKALEDFRKILLFLRYGIGDVVMELPAIDQLRVRSPAAHVTALGAKPALELLENDARVDELVSYQSFGFRHWADVGDEETLERFSQWLNVSEFDLCIDPSHAVFGAAELVWARGGAILNTNLQSARQALRSGGSGAEALRNEVMDGWGVEIPEGAPPAIDLLPQEKDYACDLLDQIGWTSKRLIGLSPVASSELKRWDVDRFAATADALLESGVAEGVLVFAGPQADVAGEIQAGMRRASESFVIGAVHLRKVAALLEVCRLFVGHDTGLSHLAAAVQTPAMVIFGPTSPRIYRPPSDRARSFGGDDDCPWRRIDSFGPPECVMQNRCFLEHPCIQAVSVTQVVESINSLDLS